MTEFIETLITSYRNEKLTKSLLPYNKKLLNFIKRALPKQIEYSNTLNDFTVVKTIIDQEIETIKYFTTNYLLARMEKMNKNFNLETEFLSDAEKIYYFSILEHFKSNDIFLDVEKFIVDPTEFVCFVCVVENKNVVIDMESVALKFGDLFVAPLKDVYDLLLKNEIFLI